MQFKKTTRTNENNEIVIDNTISTSTHDYIAIIVFSIMIGFGFSIGMLSALSIPKFISTIIDLFL